mgnify:CR=1 FL=1
MSLVNTLHMTASDMIFNDKMIDNILNDCLHDKDNSTTNDKALLLLELKRLKEKLLKDNNTTMKSH